MDVKEFREKIKQESTIVVDNIDYKIEELVKFRLDDGSFYIKCYLENDFVFADDLDNNMYLLVRPVKTNLNLPFPDSLEFDGKEFNFLFDAHATAEEVSSEKYFKKGEAESFWDFQAEDGSYLSLGISDTDTTADRADFYGKIIQPSQVGLR